MLLLLLEERAMLSIYSDADLISWQAVLKQAAGVAAAAGGDSNALYKEKMLT